MSFWVLPATLLDASHRHQMSRGSEDSEPQRFSQGGGQCERPRSLLADKDIVLPL